MYPRLDQCTLLKFEGTRLTIGNDYYLLSTLFSEKVHDELGVRQAVFLGHRGQDGLASIIKVRIEMNPRIIEDPKSRPGILEWSTRLFQNEIKALIDCQDLRSTPNLLGQSVQVQNNQYEYPGGYIHIIAMSRMPGMPVTEYSDLSDTEGVYIKARLMEILESIRLHGWYITGGYPEKVIYERSTRTVSLTSLGNSEKADLSKPEKYPFTENNDILLGFGQNVWWI
ncbi:hypothetical protein P170DRAFT_423373 [Aspergillus steynii IBT 23096]|uniref:Uncharacterized protein n=1 Tax=Aspergillus steynii IBT 23096 TaxID=1392250 RepID=A0A2I2GHZ6_9EURO|nr:uncharacterized protein P170DRAFT_423373 [Aspergillus steynii IBT 23096]PLB52506.1 hypothetical protein P170DRAFT_423373 [Aspergillus steynii IBT 23096]